MPDAIVTTTRRVPVLEPPDPRRDCRTDASPPDAADGSSAALVDALVVAWTMFRVYHDPRQQDAFRRAVATLGSPPSFPWTMEVHGGGFRHAGRPVPTRRQATPALARAIFARGIAALGFSAPPPPTTCSGCSRRWPSRRPRGPNRRPRRRRCRRRGLPTSSSSNTGA